MTKQLRVQYNSTHSLLTPFCHGNWHKLQNNLFQKMWKMPSIIFITSEEKDWVALVSSEYSSKQFFFINLPNHQVTGHAHSPKKNTETLYVSVITKLLWEPTIKAYTEQVWKMGPVLSCTERLTFSPLHSEKILYLSQCMKNKAISTFLLDFAWASLRGPRALSTTDGGRAKLPSLWVT